MKDAEDALQRLDKLTQEEARMAAAETLTITRGIDNTVKDVDERLEGVDERVQSVDVKVEGIDGKVLSVDSKVQGVNDNVLGVDKKIQGVDDKVLNVDIKVQGVDHKVSSVIQGGYFHSLAPKSLAFSSVRRNGDRSSDSAGRRSSQRLKPCVNSLYRSRSRRLELFYRERVTQGPSKMDFSPRSIY
jgi:ACT domain-containing protein